MHILQNEILRTAARSDPDVWWWIKGDGVDVVKGLGESMKGDWSGDVDLNDGKLDLLYQEYRRRLDGLKHHTLGSEIGALHPPLLLTSELFPTG